jgi:hypothetical protein
MNDCLGVFRERILLDQTFEEHETSLNNQTINELSINNLDVLEIELKEKTLTLSSVEPFYLKRTRERLIINYVPTFYVLHHNFMLSTLVAPVIHRDEEENKKIYKNLYRDETYMQLLDTKIITTTTTNLTHEEERIIAIGMCERKINKKVVDLLIESGKIPDGMRDIIRMTLSGACSGVIKPEILALFQEAKKEVVRDFNEIEQELARVKKWGFLGETDMRKRIEQDVAFYTQYNEENATKRTEWILHGNEVDQLRFLNIDKLDHSVSIHNRTLNPKSIRCDGENVVIQPYARVNVKRKGRFV